MTSGAKPALCLGILVVAWLVPNHYLPWVSAWSDFVALAAIGVAALLLGHTTRVNPIWSGWSMAVLVIVGCQLALGQLHFAGDGLMVFLYIVAFMLSIAVGSGFGAFQTRAWHPLESMAAWITAASIASVSLAAIQWTGAVSLGTWIADLPPGARPFGNVAQPNHLCSIAFLGLCSIALLREHAKLGWGAWALGSSWMLMGMVMTGSRTGWLQVAALVLMVLVLARRSALRVRPIELVAIVAIYLVGVVGWPFINDMLLLTPARGGAEIASGGTRPLHWAAMLTAIAQEPWFGYGWQQVSLAQVRTAEMQPHVGEYIEHSHNLFLDLLVWNGVPLGLLLVGTIVWWIVSRLAHCRDATVFWVMAAIMGLASHAMVEYPLSFAYFLIPAGIWIGAVDALQGHETRWTIPARAPQVAGLLFGLLLAWVSFDYLKAEQGYRLLRLEAARIGAKGLTTPPPDLQLLTQLEAFQRFAHTEARAGMSAAEVDAMRKVAERYAYPPSLFRYALAQGLNGDTDGAALTLLRLCRIHPRVRCDEGRQAWASLQQQHSVLRSIAFPSDEQIHVLK